MKSRHSIDSSCSNEGQRSNKDKDRDEEHHNGERSPCDTYGNETSLTLERIITESVVNATIPRGKAKRRL